jgi:E3 ubiquitin-protein ligase HUWE1
VSQALSISTPRLQSLARRWPHLREYGVDIIHLSSIAGTPVLDSLPPETREVNFTFYKSEKAPHSVPQTDNKQMDTEHSLPSSPIKASISPINGSSGATNIHLDEQILASKSAMELLSDCLVKHELSSDDKFELLCRIRTAKSLMKGNSADREKLIVMRLLAIAIFGHTHPESQASSLLFLYEPDLINHIAELLQVDKGVPLQVQTYAIAALDALSRYRSKIQEVLTAVNAGVNHGILMALLRKTISHINNAESTIPHSFVEALLSFITFIASHASGGNMVVGAGLIPLLVQLLENRLSHRLPVISKAMQLVDNILYGYTTGFSIFCAARGVDVLVDRIEVSPSQFYDRDICKRPFSTKWI